MSKKISVSVALAVTIIAMAITFSITWIVSMVYFNRGVADLTTKQAQYNKLSELDNYVRGNYYGTINDSYLFDRLALGYVSGLGDPYSVYYTEREFTELQQIESGDLVGIGVEVTRDAAGYFYIARVYADSPAERAGLTSGMRILSVGDTDTKTVATVRALHSLLRGGIGTEVSISGQTGEAEPQTYTVQRSNYLAPTVELIMVGGYAYIRISSFGPNTAAEFETAAREAQAQNAKALVFDVRGNQSIQWDSAYKAIDIICPRGVIAKSESAAGVKKVLATSGEEYVDLPMVVLVNENTAAAAELFAASVRVMSGGRIVGTKTQGHGTIQSSPQRLSDGSAISITTAKLLLGNDESFDSVGLTPDAEVSSTGEDEYMLYNPTPPSDPQIMRAVEQARSLVRAAGGDPGPAITFSPGTSSPPGGTAGSESLVPDDSSSPSDDSTSEGDSSEADSSAA